MQRARQAAGQKLLRNVAANYAGTILNIGLPLLTLPIYLNHLGDDNWGLVSFFTLFVSILSIFDVGCRQALVKEFANRAGSSPENSKESANLLFGYERVYMGLALAIALLATPFASSISSRWLNLGELPHETGLLTIYCAIAMLTVQLPGSIYRTVLSGRQQQVQLNKIQMVFTLLRHTVSIILVLRQPNIHLYLLWQVLCACMETVYTSTKAWKEVGRSRSISRWDSEAMRKTSRFAAIMAVSVLLGAATNMIDKFYISAQLPIAQLGYYGIASSVSLGLLSLSYPVFIAVLPRLAELKADTQATLNINIRLLVTVTCIFLVFLFLYLVAGRTVLSLWLNNESAVIIVTKVLDLLLIGCALNVYYNIGYTNWVATGKSKIILGINIASFLVAIIVTPIAIYNFGLIGAPAGFVLMNLIGACVSLIWLARIHLVKK